MEGGQFKTNRIIHYRLSIILFFLLAFFISVNPTFAQRDVSKLRQWEAEGDTLISEQRYEEAAKMFSQIVEATGLRERADYNALYKRAISYYYIEGKEDLALADVDKFIKMFPQVPQSHILRALIYRIKDNDEKQLEDLNIAIDYQPSNAGLLKWRAGLLLDSKEYVKAKRDAQTAILFEDDPEAEAYLAFAQFNLNHADSALMAINKAIDLDYSYLPAYLYGGSFCLQEKEFDLALKYLNLGLRVDPDNLTALFYKGVALVEMERTDEGCRYLNKAFYKGYDDASDYIQQYCYSPAGN
jgi:Tfp pilus assembly protein PilF